ncbi:PucR family transcriptional regulator ligand-binding domain-containing protein, partial [Kitasatospora sp. NPDC001574]
MLPTVAHVLDLEVMRRGLPQVVAGAAHLERPVRWVHVSELPDVAGVLQGGELVLSTGIALPEDREGLARYVRDLADVGVAGLVIEFGRRYFDTLPRALVHAAEQRGLPLIALRRELRFVAVTEAVHALVVNAQLEQLRTSEAIHQVFNELVVEGAEPVEVVRQVARIAGAPVVLENLAHQVLTHDPAGRPEADLLEDWERRSRGVRPPGRTGHDPRSGWLVTTVGARGQDWGRLVLVQDPGPLPDDGPHPNTMLLERGASALALNRLVVRDRESLERQTHRTLLSGILTHALTVSEVALRAQALGVPLESRRLVGVVLRQRRGPIPAALEAQARLRDFTELAASAVRACRLSALVGALDDEGVGVLIALGPQQEEHASLDAFAAALRRLAAEAARDAASPSPVVAVGSSVGSVRDARRT